MDSSVRVAVVRGDRRRGAVADALGLISDELNPLVFSGSGAVLIPNLDSCSRSWASTDRDTLSATVDAVLGAGAGSITVMAGARSPGPMASECFTRLGYRAELWGRPVSFVDVDSGVDQWQPMTEPSPGTPAFRVPAIAAGSTLRISLAVAKTHGLTQVGLGLPNLVSLLPAPERALLSGYGGLSGCLGDRTLARVLETSRGCMVRAWLWLRSIGGGMRLTRLERRRLESIGRSTELLISLARCLAPRLSVIDGFVGMQGDGPRHGSAVSLGTVIAGTDPVAVDAVAAAIMGFEPLEIPYLRQAQAIGLGTADLAAITLVGDPWSQVRRRVRRHSADRLLRLAGSVMTQHAAPRPHFQQAGRRNPAGPVPARIADRLGIDHKVDRT